MEWIERLNSAVNYIEEHLTEEVDYERLGQLACCSSFHFQRMFGYMAGVPLSEYIRRRRMSRAAVELCTGVDRIVDIALKYGYDSPTAFNRAFQTVHGFAPSQARAQGATLKSYPPISFQITIKGAEQMNYRIEKKEAFRIVGRSMPIAADMEQNMATIPGFWGQSSAEGLIEQLCPLMNGEPKGVLGVCVSDKGEDWRYYIAVASTLPAAGLEEKMVPAATWAIFPGAGSSVSIQELEKRVVSEWLPTSGYEYGNAPDVEVYIDPNPADTKYEVWVPVVKKND